MDTGPVLQSTAVTVQPDDTAESLTARLSVIGASLLVETLAKWMEGAVTPVPQDDSQATYAPPLTKEDGRINWYMPAEGIERQVRAMTPWPGAFTSMAGKGLKIFKAEIFHDFVPGSPGVSNVTDKIWVVATGEGALSFLEVQLEGKKRQDIQSFLKGFKQRGEIAFISA
jgi:methionyl-tRNA formyltransferase